MPESHTCQRCNQPLVLDPSIENLTPSSYSLITAALPQPSTSTLSPQSKLASLPPSSRASAEIWAQSNGISTHPRLAESFVFLPDSILPSSAGAGAGSGSAGSGSASNRPGSSRQGSGSSVSSVPPTRHGATPGHLVDNLHAILSSRTPIDHPLCTQCTALLQSELQRELEDLTRERDAYIEFQRGIARNKEMLGKSKAHAKVKKGDGEEDGQGLGAYDLEGTEDEWEALVKRKKELEKEEERLKVELEEREKELDKAKEAEERAKEEDKAVDKEEEEFLRAHAELSTELKHLDETLSTAKTRLLLSQSLLAHLESTNVYNDAFQIGHVPLEQSSAGGARGGLTVGTINGLRLGGRPVVEWDEINAAWGLVALCIDRIAVKVGCSFEGHKIVPLGSFSRIEELAPGRGIYELFASSDISKLLQNRRFSYALVSLLDLLRQLVDFGDKHNRGWGVGNVEIRKDRISGHSIRLPGIAAMQMPTLSTRSIMGLGGASGTTDAKDAKRDSNPSTSSSSSSEASGEEQWTRACRAVLAVLKRILIVESEADRTAVASAAPSVPR